MLLLVLTLSYLGLGGCGLCGAAVKKETLSPDNSLIATEFRSDCGATTGYKTGVSIRLANEAFDSGQTPIMLLEGDRDVVLAWTASRELTLSVPADGEYTGRHQWKDVTIKYRRLSEKSTSQ